MAAAESFLRKTLDDWGSPDDDRDLLAAVLRAVQDLVGGLSSSIWRREGRGGEAYVLELAIQADGSAPGSKADVHRKGAPAGRWVELGRASLHSPPTQRQVEDDALLDDAQKASLLRLGVRAWLNVNLTLADTHLGVLIVRLPHEGPIADGHRRLIARLAQRAALALYRSHVAQKAFEEARIREREAAVAKTRAEKLALASTLLRETSDRFGTSEDVDVFLGRILLPMCEIVGGHSAAVWLTDPEDPEHFLLHHLVEDGRVVPGVQSSHVRRKLGTTPTARSRLNPLIHGPRAIPFQFHLVTDGDMLHPDEAAQLLALGVRQLLMAPLSLGERLLGYLSIRLNDDRAVLQENLDLVQALAGEAAVAINLARLAEEAKQAAVAREREATERNRADALHRANAVLRTMLNGLSEQQDLSAFLGEALTVCASELGAVGADVWIRISPGEHGLLMSAEHGEIRTPVDDKYIRRVRPTRGLEPKLARGRIAFTTRAANAPGARVGDPAHHPFASDRHVISQANVPMFIGDRWLGALAFRHDDDIPGYPPEKEELALALGNQIALALEMQRLALAVGEAARAEERALAARQRTESAERTARTVRASLDMLAEEPEPERFLGHVLRATNSQFGVSSSTLWLHDPETGIGRLHMICDESRLTVDPLDANGEPYVIRLGDWPSWRGLIDNRLPIALEVDPKHPALEQIRVRLNLNKARSVLVVPLIFGAVILGVLIIRDSLRDAWTEEELSLSRALAHQATLALQLTRLAAKAQQGAVLQERNRLAREIHDTLAQGFAAIRMQLELVCSHPALPEEAAEALDAACKIAAESIVEARRSMAVLTSERPSLVTALSAAVEGVRRVGPTPVVTEFAVAPEPPPQVGHELSRICQEAMLNAVRHAEASAVRITLSAFSNRGVRLAVSDDGKGFDPDTVKKGFGLASLRDRASAIDAELTIVSEPGGGAEVIATWVPD
ncbi:MAG TPA: GAF domain-containing protein [Caulobacteraceae bacterium]|nr:GAF domain-containing protein [Caulobacteraceae bacterium]